MFTLLTMAAVASVGLGVASTVMNANAQKKAAQSQKDQLAIQAAGNAANSALAHQNADLALSSAKANSEGVLKIAGENNANLLKVTGENNADLLKITNDNNANLLKVTGDNNRQLLSLTETNATARQGITDINVGLATSISNFNDQVADGQGKLLIGRGEIEAAASERNAITARMNAGYQEQAAQDTLDASHQEEQASRLNYARLKSTQRATLAANGVALDEGSALRIQTDTDYYSDVDGATIHANGIRAAMGYRQQESNSLNAASQYDVGASVARINAATEAASVHAQAAGAKMATDRDIQNMKLSTSFEILKAQESALVATTNASTDAATRVRNASADTATRVRNATTDAQTRVRNNSDNAAIASTNYLNAGRVEATNYEMQAGGFESASAAETAQRNGISPNAVGTAALIGGAASVAGKWFTYQQSGAFGG